MQRRWRKWACATNAVTLPVSFWKYSTIGSCCGRYSVSLFSGIIKTISNAVITLSHFKSNYYAGGIIFYGILQEHVGVSLMQTLLI